MHRRARGRRQRGDRLRDGAPARQFASAPGADERGGRADGAAHGRAPPHASRRGPRGAGGRAFPACARPGSSFSVPGCRGWRPPRWPWACTPTSTCSTATWTGCAKSTTTSAARWRRWRRRQHAIEEVCIDADIVIGAVLVVGARAPAAGLRRPGREDARRSVLVDISVDQGGCFESTRPTTHSNPTFEVHGSIFYCVANMPGAVPHTSTHALANATLPYTLSIASHGWKEAVRARSGAGRGRQRGGRPGGLRTGRRGPRSPVHSALDASRVEGRGPAAIGTDRGDGRSGALRSEFERREVRCRRNDVVTGRANRVALHALGRRRATARAVDPVEEHGAEDVGDAIVRRLGGRTFCECGHRSGAFGAQPRQGTFPGCFVEDSDERLAILDTQIGERPGGHDDGRRAVGSSCNTPGSTSVASPATTRGGIRPGLRDRGGGVREAVGVRPDAGEEPSASSGLPGSIGERSIPTRDANGGSCLAMGGRPPTTWHERRTAASTGPVAPYGP